MNLAVKVDALERQHAVALRLLARHGWQPFGYHIDVDRDVEREFFGDDLSSDGLPVFERIKTR